MCDFSFMASAPLGAISQLIGGSFQITFSFLIIYGKLKGIKTSFFPLLSANACLNVF